MEQLNVDMLYFSKEAASYLSISVQRLNQLVSSGQISPIKRSAGCMLFSRKDLDLRLQEVQNISVRVDVNPNMINKIRHVKSSIFEEAILYFTIQSFLNYSDKKSYQIYLNLLKHFGVIENLQGCDFKLIAKEINIPFNDFEKRFLEVEASFNKLPTDVTILRYDNPEYPSQLREVNDYPPFIFTRGNIDLFNETIISVVGSRTASVDGLNKAYKLSHLLGRSGIVVASGLAKGIDTYAHKAAIDGSKPTIAVIGTPIDRVYPRENSKLQETIIDKGGLVVSQFGPNEKVQRWFFPLRNGTMSAISNATVIVEAGETSGALKQADYAIKQKRMLFIPQSALQNDNIEWPKNYIKKHGAFEFVKINDLLHKLNEQSVITDVVLESQ